MRFALILNIEHFRIERMRSRVLVKTIVFSKAKTISCKFEILLFETPIDKLLLLKNSFMFNHFNKQKPGGGW